MEQVLVQVRETSSPPHHDQPVADESRKSGYGIGS
jgi:hypothetical protein